MRFFLPCALASALVACGDGSQAIHDPDHAVRDAAAEGRVDRGVGDGPRDGRADGPVDAGRADGRAPDLQARDQLPPDQKGPDWGACTPVVAHQSPDPWSIRAPSAGFGGVVTQASGGHTDVFLKSPTNLIRVGARLDWGGTIVFFGLSADPNSNVIDANDTGRELQVAIYDPDRGRQGCAFDASCKTSTINCGNSITFLGWNPVQGGDECNHGAPVLSHGAVGDALRLKIQPLHWNPDWAAPDCRKTACGAQGLPVDVTYLFELRFVREHVVEVMTEVTSQETFSHAPTAQELPTLYVSNGKGGPDLPVLVDAAGVTPPINTPANDGFYHDAFTSPAPWVSWQNASQTYGVGLAMDQGITLWDGWRGDGVKAPYFHNVRARIVFGLPAGGTVRGLSYLALGGFGTIKSELEAALKKRPPFGWLDAPAWSNDTFYKAGQPLTVAGWVLDTAKIAQVRVEVGGKQVGQLSVNQQRADVCAIYPAYAGCPQVGFSGSIPTTGLAACPQLMRVIARDADGNETVLGERRLVRAP